MSTAAPSVRQPRRLRLPIFEALTLVGLAGITGIHLLDLGDKMDETPYLGWAYIGLMVGCALAAVLLLRGDHRGFLLAGALAAATLVGYCLSRSTGLPAATDDIGNWTETLGVWSLVAEAAVVGVSAMALVRRREARRA